jgi:hypothetical protein
MARIFYVIPVASLFFRSVLPQATPTAVQPAAETISALPANGFPLSSAESVQLTESVLSGLESDPITSEIAKLLDFEEADSAVVWEPGSCKTYPGDEQWPEQKTWDLFNALLGNALIQTVPIAAPCYDSQWGQKNLSQCNAIVNAFGKAVTQ